MEIVELAPLDRFNWAIDIHIDKFCFTPKICSWVDEEMGDEALMGIRWIYFVNKIDAMTFKMRWG